LRDLVEGLGAIVWQADARDWRFSLVSRNAEEVLGYPIEQWLNEPDFWINHIHPEDRAIAIRICSTATARGEDHKFEYRAIAADGRTVWLRDIVRVVLDDDGRPRELRGLMIDITEQKLAEQGLRESEERFRQLAENIREVFWLADVEVGRVLYVSPAYEQVWGRSCQSVYDDPRSVIDAVHPEDRPRLLRAYENMIQNRVGFSEEFRIVRPDGKIRWVRDHSFPVRDSEGRVYRFVGSAEDITDRRESEAVLSESEERFRKLFEESPISAAIIGLDFRILRANQALSVLLHRTRAEIERLHCGDCTHPDDMAQNLALFNRLFAGEIPGFRCEKRLLRPDREAVWVHMAVSLVRSEDGRPLYAFAMAEDVTEQHHAAERLRELSGRLIRLQDEERRRIARELHDSTGQNLAALKLNLSHLRDGYLEPDVRNVVSDSLQLTERMLQEIRTLSYLLHPPLLDELGLDSAIRAYVTGFSERSGIEVFFNDPPDLGRLGKDLEIAIFRIIQESLTNIHRHSGSRRGWISIELASSEILVEVRDEGIGFSPGAFETRKTLGVGISGMRERAHWKLRIEQLKQPQELDVGRLPGSVEGHQCECSPGARP